MRIKKMTLTILFMLIIGLFSLPASAVVNWYTCHVKGIGISLGQVYINLEEASTNPSFTNVYFIPYSGSEKETLATALTAQANGVKVLVYIDPTQASQANRVIYSIFVLEDQ